MQKRVRDNSQGDGPRLTLRQRILIKKNGRLRFEWWERFRYWFLGGRSITRSIFRIAAATQGVAIITGVLTVGYVMASFYTQSGEFVIRVDHPGEKLLILSDTPEFEEELITLTGTAIREADNISIYDLDPRVADIDGDHNGIDYLAYTFYVKNIGFDPITYTYSLNISKATEGIENAVWVLLYQNDEHRVLANASAGGGVESQHSDYPFPFEERAKHPEQYTYNEATGVYTLTTEAFVAPNVVDTDTREAIEPQEVDKYTVVVWLEGEDPECVNDILGGTIEMTMKLRY